MKDLYTEEEKTLLARTLADKGLINYAIAIDSKYEPAWFHEVIASKLEQAYYNLEEGKRTRIIIEIPPRHGKTDLSSIKFPSWVLGKRPQTEIILTTYAQDLASDFGLATRDLMNSQNYKVIFDTKLRADSKAKAKWLTDKGGGYTAVGVGGPITGKGFNIGIIDDPIKNREEADSEVIRESVWKWYRSTFLTREEGNGAIIIIMTRWHDDDLVGRILAEDNDWEVIKFPAIAVQDETDRKQGEALWKEKFPLEILEDRRKNLGPYEFSSLYQQDPVDEESREFKQSWFKYRTLEELSRMNTRKFVTIDTAYKQAEANDFVGVTLNMVDRENMWNLMTWKLKVSPKEFIDFLFKLHSDYSPELFGIEEGAYNVVIKPFIEDEMRKRGIFFKITELKHNQQNKHLRIRGLIPRYSSGSIFHIEGMCNELEEELMRFPKGIHDDVVDSAAYQLDVAKAPRVKPMVASKPARPFYGDREVAF